MQIAQTPTVERSRADDVDESRILAYMLPRDVTFVVLSAWVSSEPFVVE